MSGRPKLFDFVTTFSPKIEANLRNLYVSVQFDSESVRSLISVIHIQQLSVADRKLQMFPTGLFYLNIFG